MRSIPKKKNICATDQLLDIVIIFRLEIKIANQNITVPVYHNENVLPF